MPSQLFCRRQTKLSRSTPSRFISSHLHTAAPSSAASQANYLLNVLYHEVRLPGHVLAAGGDRHSHEVAHSNVKTAVRLVRLLGQVEIEAILLVKGDAKKAVGASTETENDHDGERRDVTPHTVGGDDGTEGWTGKRRSIRAAPVPDSHQKNERGTAETPAVTITQ